MEIDEDILNALIRQHLGMATSRWAERRLHMDIVEVRCVGRTATPLATSEMIHSPGRGIRWVDLSAGRCWNPASLK